MAEAVQFADIGSSAMCRCACGCGAVTIFYYDREGKPLAKLAMARALALDEAEKLVDTAGGHNQ